MVAVIPEMIFPASLLTGAKQPLQPGTM